MINQTPEKEMKTIICWRLPIKIANEGNSSEHWTKKARRHKTQKGKIKSLFISDKPNIKPPCLVRLTRIAPRMLDAHDNLRTSLKWIVDAIASELTGNYIAGQADSDRDIHWEYDQEKGSPKEYGLRIEIIKDD